MKIVFIASSIQDPHAIKRVEEFANEGFEVILYGFSRKRNISLNAQKFPVKCLGEFSNDTPYRNRIRLIYNGIREVRNLHNADKVIWFYFGLDIALLSMMVCHTKPYIYEECDLVHTYIGNSFIRHIFEVVDKYIIRKSLMSIFTSEGFLRYHFRSKIPSNTYVITNRLNANILQVPMINKQPLNHNHLRFAFVGGARFDSLLSFSEIILKNYPNHSFHFFGEPVSEFRERFFKLKKKYSNCFFHGPFKNPDDLPAIYSQIDIVVSTYDAKYVNVRYAEPNKIYEAIYFATPIVVTKGTYLGDKVSYLNIGYVVDPFDEQEVCEWVEKLSDISISEKRNSCRTIDKKTCININSSFFSEFRAKVTNVQI